MRDFSLPTYSGRKSPAEWLSSSLNSMYSPTSKTSRSSSRRSLLLVTYAIVFFSLLTSRIYCPSKSLLKELEHKKYVQELHLTESGAELKELRLSKDGLQKNMKKLKKAYHAFKHEIRMVEELKEDGANATQMPTAKDGSSVQKWVDNRLSALKHKLNTLEMTVREQSKQEVISRYGPGPHKVRFNLEIMDGQDVVDQSFTVQLADVNDMPHSVLLFLDMVESKVWDDTALLHHPQLEHLIASAPIDFQTHQMKFQNLNRIGWETLGYPEYSSKYTHSKYTLGFAHLGPTFYINTLDNSDFHGPDGQGHHLLPDDADPCFAQVIDGKVTIDSLVRHGKNQRRVAREDSNFWAKDQETALTHILSIERL